jgi:hypothetical protein
MIKMFCVILVSLVLMGSPVFASEDYVVDKAMTEVLVFKRDSIEILNPYQIKVYAYQIGATVNLGETLRAITYLESHFGQTGRIGDKGIARGITQIQIPTAKFILNKLMGFDHKFTDKEIKMLLTSNDKLCIIMSKNYLVYLMNKFKHDEESWQTGLLSYNIGPGNAKRHGTAYDPNGYLTKAKKFINKERGS